MSQVDLNDCNSLHPRINTTSSLTSVELRLLNFIAAHDGTFESDYAHITATRLRMSEGHLRRVCRSLEDKSLIRRSYGANRKVTYHLASIRQQLFYLGKV